MKKKCTTNSQYLKNSIEFQLTDRLVQLPMTLEHSDEDRAFRQLVRAFCATHVPDALRATVRHGMRPTPEAFRGWQAILHRQGWGAPSWPREFGGTGWSPVQLHVFEQETAAHLRWPEAKVRAAMHYAEAFLDEIDAAIEENEAVSFDDLKRLLPQAEILTP